MSSIMTLILFIDKKILHNSFISGFKLDYRVACYLWWRKIIVCPVYRLWPLTRPLMAPSSTAYEPLVSHLDSGLTISSLFPVDFLLMPKGETIWGFIEIIKKNEVKWMINIWFNAECNMLLQSIIYYLQSTYIYLFRGSLLLREIIYYMCSYWHLCFYTLLKVSGLTSSKR